jgi:hypothetical protein
LNTTIRFLVTVVAGVAALAFAGTALAAYNPSLLVAGTTHTTGGSGPLVIGIGQDATDDATAATTVYSPPGYGVTLGQPAGTQLGTLSANVKVAALNNARIDVTGTVKTDNPANYVTNPCSPGTHEAVWVLEFNLSGTIVRLPMYVDRVTAGPEQQPEYRRHRSFHGCIHSATSRMTMKAATATPRPAAVIRFCGTIRPPITRRGMVFGMI